jgi:hypothetical protein
MLYIPISLKLLSKPATDDSSRPPDLGVVERPGLEMEDYSLISPMIGLARANRSRTLISMSL